MQHADIPPPSSATCLCISVLVVVIVLKTGAPRFLSRTIGLKEDFYNRLLPALMNSLSHSAACRLDPCTWWAAWTLAGWA